MDSNAYKEAVTLAQMIGSLDESMAIEFKHHGLSFHYERLKALSLELSVTFAFEFCWLTASAEEVESGQ